MVLEVEVEVTGIMRIDVHPRIRSHFRFLHLGLLDLEAVMVKRLGLLEDSMLVLGRAMVLRLRVRREDLDLEVLLLKNRVSVLNAELVRKRKRRGNDGGGRGKRFRRIGNVRGRENVRG